MGRKGAREGLAAGDGFALPQCRLHAVTGRKDCLGLRRLLRDDAPLPLGRRGGHGGQLNAPARAEDCGGLL